MSILAISDLSGKYNMLVSIGFSKHPKIIKYDDLVIKTLSKYESKNLISVEEVEVSEFIDEEIYSYFILLKCDKYISNKLFTSLKKIAERCDKEIMNNMNFVLPIHYN